MTKFNLTFWGQREGIRPDLLCGRSADYMVTPKDLAMLTSATIMWGGFLGAFLKNSEVIVLTALSLTGFVVGRMAYGFIEVFHVIYPLLRTPNFSIYSCIAPLIVFLAALDVDCYTLKNMLWQVSLIGLISFSTMLLVIGFVAVKLNRDSWDLQCCLLFSMAVSLTDPLHSVKSLKHISISNMYTDIIRGESLIICCITCIFFGILRSSLPHVLVFREFHIIMDFSLSILGSVIFGYWCARFIEFITTDLFSRTLINAVLCISMVYLTFYIVEFFEMSGMTALAIAGLNLDSLSFKPRMKSTITKFLAVFSSAFPFIIYGFFGMVVGCGKPTYFQFYTMTFTLVLFVTLNFVRLFTVALVSPILMHSSYKYGWKWAVIISLSGIKGIFSLLLAPDVYNLAEWKSQVPEMFILYVQIISLMTMGVNSNMMTYLARKLGMYTISLPRQMALRNASLHVQEITQNTMKLSKTQKTLANVNWILVEGNTTFKYSIPTTAYQLPPVSHGEEEQELPQDEVLIEEARLHVAIIQMSSFEKQRQNGVLNIKAARILIGATKSYCPIQGKFMSIHDVSTYIKARSWLIKFKNILTALEYRKDKAHIIAYGKNKFLKFTYYIVFSEEFEYAGHVMSLIYIYPIIIHLWPVAREFNVLTLILVNYYFIFLYALQSALKIIILKRKYFHQHWNTLEFFILLLGIFDILCVYFVRLRPDNMALIQTTVIMGYLRIIRFIPLLKTIIPLLIKVVDVQIKKRLSLMYSITKGYIKSQEDAKSLVKQISGRGSVYQKLYEILETNKQDAITELGLIEHEGRDVVIALKTGQTIQAVTKKSLKYLSFLWSKGTIFKHEGIKANKVLLLKIRTLNNFPMGIPPPTADNYLPKIIWLENKEVLIKFFKERAKLAYFDYGDVICKEGEMPQGIYLIISGMAVLHSSPPSFGISHAVQPARESRTISVEYCTCGDIVGELSCLLKREFEYTVICETILQACFISLEDLYEGFDVFWPFLEYKIWLKLALSIAHRYCKSAVLDEDLTFQKCLSHNVAYVETLSNCNEMTINYATVKLVIIVYGSVIDTNTEVPYLAPCILPKTCEQVQGTSDLSKLLVIQAPETVRRNNSKVMGSITTSPHVTNTEYNWKRKDEVIENILYDKKHISEQDDKFTWSFKLEAGFHYRKRY